MPFPSISFIWVESFIWNLRVRVFLSILIIGFPLEVYVYNVRMLVVQLSSTTEFLEFYKVVDKTDDIAFMRSTFAIKNSQHRSSAASKFCNKRYYTIIPSLAISSCFFFFFISMSRSSCSVTIFSPVFATCLERLL